MKTKKHLLQAIKTILVFILNFFFTAGLNAQTIDCNLLPELSCGDYYGSQLLSTQFESDKFNYYNNYNSCYNTNSTFNESDLIFKHVKTDYSDTYVTLFNYGNVDLDLFLFDYCSWDPSYMNCISASANGYGEIISGANIDYILLTEPGTYFFVVDGYQSGEKGDFYINIGCDDLQYSDCDNVPPVYCNIPKDSTTCEQFPWTIWTTKINNYDCLSNHPKKATMTGRESVTSFTAPETGEYTISLSNLNEDLDLFIIEDACSGGGGGGGGQFIVARSSSYNCLDFSANFGTVDEEIVISLDKDEKIYLVVDGFLDACGTYTLLVNCPTEDEPCDFCCFNINPTYTDCVGFENYTFGNLLPQGSKKFKLYNPSTSNNSQSGSVVGGGKAKTGNWCLYLDATTDIDYKINRQINDIARLEWSMLFEKYKYGAVGLQIGDQNNYPIFIYFGIGIAKVYRKESNNQSTLLTQFSYKENKWEQYALIIRSDGRMGANKGEIELWKDSTFIYRIKNIKINSLVDFNMFYHPDNQFNSGYYIDNICYSEQKKAIYFPQYFEPTCVDGQSDPYANPHYAYDAGYTSCEISTCESCTEGDFETFAFGNISTQSSTDSWALWPNGGDGVITNEKSYSGSKSLKITYSNPKSDLVFKLGNLDQADGHWDGNDVYRYSWKMYVPSGKSAYYNMQHAESLSHWAYEVYFDQNGKGNLRFGDPNSQYATFSFPFDNWFSVTQIIRIQKEEAELWINGKFVFKWVFSSGYLSNGQYSGSNQIGAFNFSHGNNTNAYYFIDNFLCNSGERCFGIMAPIGPPIVCVNGKQYGNTNNDQGSLMAYCDGYSDEEWTVGPCSGTNPTSLVFDIDDNVCGPVGQIVTIPVRVKGFSKVSSFQFSISLADISKGEITGIEKGNIAGDLNYSIASASTATIVWDNVSPIDLADNYVVFNIKLKIKSAFTGTTDINITGNPTDISAEQNNKTVKPSVIKGSFCSTAASTFKICGKIIREDNVAVPNVLVTLSGGKSATTNTNSIGEYCFDNLNANLSYTVKPSKNTDHKNGVNTGDVTAIRRHILALEKLNSPYKIIAADASKSNVVNTGDVTEIRKLILALISQFSTTESWSFVPESHVFSNPANPFAASIPNSLIINNLNSNLSDQNFIGIKIGDVNLNNTPSNIIETAENRSSNNINLIVGSANVKTNQNFDIDITVKQFNEITSGQFSVNWNTNISEFISLKNLNSILGLTNDNFNLSLTSGGKLGFLWDSPTPVTLPDNIKLFSISFKAKSNGSASINITDDPVAKYFENKDQQGLNIIVSNGIVTVPTTELYGNEKVNIYPNPTNDFVNFESDYNIRSIEILNCTGQNIRKISGLNASKGLVDLSDQISGIYFLKFRTDEGDVFRKINLIK